MADMQRAFEQFHDTIRTDYEMNATLIEKREIILERIRRYLTANHLPGFDELLQGSYRMKTGVVPLPGLEYDIDVGLRFAVTPAQYAAETVRAWVLAAVADHTLKIESKGPCIRVTYVDGYHVDLVVYAYQKDAWGREQFWLGHRDNGWRDADPPGLLAHVKTARAPFAGTNDAKTGTDQFRRIVRYLRRWNDVQLLVSSDGKPTGLAFVLLAAQRLQPRRTWSGAADDRQALEAFAASAAATVGRIVAQKPTPEYEDMFGRLSDQDMDALKVRFGLLTQALHAANETKDLAVASTILRRVFGDDFPVLMPEAKVTAGPAIVPSSSSA